MSHKGDLGDTADWEEILDGQILSVVDENTRGEYRS